MSIENKALPTLRNGQQDGDVPGFTEFKLDPFQLHGTSHLLLPHQHREATRVFCLRLQPRPRSQLANTLKQFQDQCYLQCGPNQAHRAPPHLSLLGNISVDCDTHSTARWQAVDVLIQLLDEEIKKALIAATTTTSKPPPHPTFGGYSVKDKPTRSVNMRIAVPRLYTRLSQHLQHSISKDYLTSNIRLDHPPSFLSSKKSSASLSSSFSSAPSATTASPSSSTSSTVQLIPLAYNVLKSISREDAQCIRSLANDLINVNRWVNGKESSWELALHEIMLESQAVGKTQQVTTIKTWSLDDNGSVDPSGKGEHHSDNSMALIPSQQQAKNKILPTSTVRSFTWSSFIPTSLRVKLSVLSSRFR
ncbi:hypothetical protein BCR42DRAFT_428819 [Absidia repens]|uniref:Uncharacterized protein n=1 Tax=Absidia repens TaxID=90262 RepID=A0A1X2HXS8_9FUNG|nr:hypothetical protein BCR42DRAFT_428819 [Absidia repens]